MICPAVWPFDQGSTNATATAALSLDNPLAKDASRLQATVSIQASRVRRPPLADHGVEAG